MKILKHPVNRYFFTIISEALMALVNVITAIVIAQNFDTEYFATYLSIAAVLAIISIPMQSVQNAYAIGTQKPSLSTNNYLNHTSVNKLFVFLSLIWLCSIPFLYIYSEIEISTLIASSALFFVLFPSTVVSGKLRNLQQFSEWRLLLAITSMFQIPVVIMTAVLKLDLWTYLLLLCIPSLLYVSLASLVFKLTVLTDKKMVFVKWTSLLYSVVFSFSFQLPLVLAAKLLSESEIKSILIFYFFSITISLGSVFGTFFVPRFLSGSFVPKLRSKTNLVFCTPSILLGIILFTPIKHVFPLIFGEKYSISLSGGFGLLFLLSSVIWSIYSSHAQIRLGIISWRILTGGIMILVLEGFYLILFVKSFNEIIMVHFIASIFQFINLNEQKNQQSSKSTI